MLEVKDLRVRFWSRPEKYAVDGVSFHMDDGEILGLVGESGSGKSVTAMAISGLLPRRKTETAGSILLDGREMLNADREEVRKIQGKDLSVVFQEPMTSLDPVMRIGPQVEESLRIHTRMNALERRAAALSAMEEAELRDPEIVYEKYPHELSGGMLQRVMIAAAIVSEPKLLLADEPTTALDVTIQAQVLDTIQALRKKLDMSMILITHDLGIVAQTCEQVAIIYGGEVVEYADVFTIFENRTHPYTQGLFNSIPKLNEDVNRLVPIEGLMPDPTNLPTGCKFCTRC